MPRWEVHISIASMAILVISTGAFIGIFQNGPSLSMVLKADEILRSLILGGAALLLGSVMPDLDGKGRIRWTISPLLGAFFIIPPFLGRFSIDPGEAFIFIWNEGARLFLIVTMCGAILLFLPFRHRGWMHSIMPGILLGTTWGTYTWTTGSLGIEGAVLAGMMGAVGYLWHLSLDGKLSF